MQNNWTPISTLPPLDENQFSDDIYVKVDGRKKTGWYDGETKQWYANGVHDLPFKCTPTHWMPISTK